MTEEEILIRARDAAFHACDHKSETLRRAYHDGSNDAGGMVRAAASALRDLSKPLSELQPVDPDLLEAREIVKATLAPDRHARCHCRDEIDVGKWDTGQKIRATIAGLKRGRELAQESHS